MSNEDSANQSNVNGENINHQYSKTYEFETDFRNFTKKNIKCLFSYKKLKEIGPFFTTINNRGEF